MRRHGDIRDQFDRVPAMTFVAEAGAFYVRELPGELTTRKNRTGRDLGAAPLPSRRRLGRISPDPGQLLRPSRPVVVIVGG